MKLSRPVIPTLLAVAFTADPSLDITADIIKNLNANYKSGSAAEAEKRAAK